MAAFFLGHPVDLEYALGLRFDSDSKAQEKWEK